MSTENDYKFYKQKAFLKLALGCFFGLTIIGVVVIGISTWALSSIFKPDETQLFTSDSPNEINTIEIIAKNEFPHQISTIILYGDESIVKMYRPDNISIEWHNDYEADVIFSRNLRDQETIFIKFE